MVLVPLDPLLQLVEGHLVILDDKVDLELLDTVTDGYQSVGSPDETV